MQTPKAFRWRHVSMELRSRMKIVGILNGCGPKLRWLNRLIPDQLLGLSLEESCDHHDFNYTIGGTEDDRRKADRQFYESMAGRAREKSRGILMVLRPLYILVCLAYYRAVRWQGARFFHYGKQRGERAIMGLLLGLESEGLSA